ncbi:MAG: nucleotidyltransferase [Clostridia bacterium]|nr:nucleotidyltransferase [Clostridia bacterium]
MKKILTPDERLVYRQLFTAIVQELDISKTQFENLSDSYNAVGKYLGDDPLMKAYNPLVSPQGSLRLGTIIRPINDDDDLDVDLVCRLNGKSPSWTQWDVKNIIGLRLKNHETYKKMLQNEGRRCWTLLYRQNSDNLQERYHMDILPCVAEPGYEEHLAALVSTEFSQDEIRRIAVRITDNEMRNYLISKNIREWMLSNPDGYAIWFALKCRQNDIGKQIRDIIPIGTYSPQKTVLQRVVQILKRHRDYMFRNDSDDKPISIIMTTLAAQAYQGEPDIVDGLLKVVAEMRKYIRKDSQGNYLIPNPVNVEENFADKWKTHPRRQTNFFRWLTQVESDIEKIFTINRTELPAFLKNIFGETVIYSAYARMGKDFKEVVDRNDLKVTPACSIGLVGKGMNARNTFYGNEE